MLVSAGGRSSRWPRPRAVALEPGYWGNQFRLRHAAWGEERLQRSPARSSSIPIFRSRTSKAAWCHIARGMLDRAESTLREGTIVQDRQAHLKQRYPAKGLHWLLGLVRLARGDAAEALLEFDREIASGDGQLYAPEFAMNAHDGADSPTWRTATLRRRRTIPQGAGAVPEHGRSLVGWAPPSIRTAIAQAAGDAFGRADKAIESLRAVAGSGEASWSKRSITR
jgi:hypothetical protein